MTPLIDCVFQLQMFFLLTSQFARQEYQQELNLPQAESGQAEVHPVRHRVVVHVLADESISVAGTKTSPAEFQERLGQLLHQASAEEVELRIRADHRVAYRVVEPLLLSCARNGVWRINFAVVRKSQELRVESRE
jgi:biopolymer transport protein ExbD